MKRQLIFCLMSLSLTVSAQGVWEVPQDNAQPEKAAVAKKEVKSDNPDAKYLAGAVPEVDGRVTWSRTYSVPGKTAQQLYDILLERLNNMVKEENQREGSRVAIINRDEHKMVARMKEWIIFRSTVLNLDRTQMDYSLQVECRDNEVTVITDRIVYHYLTGDAKEEHFKAEEWITDKYSLNKKGTKLYRISGKFRRKTVDRAEELFADIEKTLKDN